MTDHLTAEDAARLRSAILDIDAHATPMGEDGDGFVAGGYLISTGSLHRALGVVGHSAAKCRYCATGTTCEEYRAQGAEDYQRESLEALCAAAGVPIEDESGPRANFYLVDALAAALADSVPRAEHEAVVEENTRHRNANLLRAVMEDVEADEWITEAINAEDFDRIPWRIAHEMNVKRANALAEATELREALEQIRAHLANRMDGADMDRALHAVQQILNAALAEVRP